MNITLYIIRFLYRIRYQLIFGTAIVTGLVIYFSRFIPKTYTVKATIYTGIVSDTGLNSDQQPANWKSVENMFDNLVKLTQEKGIQKNIAIKLLAINLVHGDLDQDNVYIRAKNYQALIKIIPEDLLHLVDKTSEEKTIDNFMKYMKNDPENFLYGLLNGDGPFYSYNKLSSLEAKRLGNSDLIEISYQTTDPGITLNTIKFIYNELRAAYEDIRYKTTNDIISYYENELGKLRSQLNNMENDLTHYNIENNIINYVEQTKSIAGSYANFENRYEETMRSYETSLKLLEELDKYMKTRTDLITTNDEFIKALADITTINGKITEIETFTSEEKQVEDTELLKYKEDLINAEKRIGLLTDKINNYKESKEGISIDGLVQEWLRQTIINVKAKAELNILDKRKESFQEQYKIFSPIGTVINRQTREIKIVEESYLQVLHALNMAKLKQKNILLTSATLNTISAPTFPLMSDKSKRMLLIVAACIGSMIFILGLNLVVELLDRTLRDSERAKRLTGIPILSAFAGNNQLKYRGYIKACNRIAAAYTCNRLNSILNNDHPICINLLSIEDGEGKSFIAKFLMEYWEEQGISVKRVIAEKDFPIDTSYLLADNFDYLLKEERPNILLIEHLSIQKNNISSTLLKKADVNLLVTNAKRVWKNSDNEILKYLKSILGTTPVIMVLNNAQREVVEDFTGLLPPKSSIRSFTDRIIYLGITADNSAVK